MGRKLRTRVPRHPDELKPKTPDNDQIRKKEREYRTKMKFDYDHRHRVVEGKELSPGDRVWIPDLKVDGTVIKQHESPRSVVIQTPNGPVRRNRRMTRKVLEGSPPVHENREPVVTSVMVPDIPSASGASQEERGHLPVQEDQIAVNEPSQQETCPNRLRPRGTLRRPQRYIEEC